MSYLFGYVDTNQDMYVITSGTAGSSSLDYSHGFPATWTKVPAKVKQAVICNEDYNYAVDGYIDMNGNLYIWRTNQTPILVDTNVKQADSSEEGILWYVKNDHTLFAANVKSSISKRQVATNVAYVVSGNFCVGYLTNDGKGYFGIKSSATDLNPSFTTVGSVKEVAVTGANSSNQRFIYIRNDGVLMATPHNSITGFTRLATNVKSMKRGGWDFLYLTEANDLYWVDRATAPIFIASNVLDCHSNKSYSPAQMNAIFYTTISEPTLLKIVQQTSDFNSNAKTAPTPILSLGPVYGDKNRMGVVVEVSSSDDGITFGAYEEYSKDKIPQKRYLKFRATFSGGAQEGKISTFEFDQTKPETKVALNEFLESVDTNVKLKTLYAQEMVKDDSYVEGKLFTATIDRSRFKKVIKLEVK
ncbi:hypothetical protein FU976_07995 [Campylobacter jejuni]|nr:hypothetical protein [Campylobacter jejuni]